MYRGTTPNVHIDVGGVDLKSCKKLVVTLKQLAKTLDKTGDALTVGEGFLEFMLTQEETLQFSIADVQLQLRGITQAGTVFASDICTISMEQILKDGVLYADR